MVGRWMIDRSIERHMQPHSDTLTNTHKHRERVRERGRRRERGGEEGREGERETHVRARARALSSGKPWRRPPPGSCAGSPTPAPWTAWALCVWAWGGGWVVGRRRVDDMGAVCVCGHGWVGGWVVGGTKSTPAPWTAWALCGHGHGWLVGGKKKRDEWHQRRTLHSLTALRLLPLALSRGGGHGKAPVLRISICLSTYRQAGRGRQAATH